MFLNLLHQALDYHNEITPVHVLDVQFLFYGVHVDLGARFLLAFLFVDLDLVFQLCYFLF